MFAVDHDASPLLILQLEHTRVTRAASNAAKAGGGIELSLTFDRIHWTHIDPDTGVQTSGCWDVALNRRC